MLTFRCLIGGQFGEGQFFPTITKRALVASMHPNAPLPIVDGFFL